MKLEFKGVFPPPPTPVAEDGRINAKALRALLDDNISHGCGGFCELLREIRTSTHGGYAIGDSRFREEIEHALHRRATPRDRPTGSMPEAWGQPTR